MTISRNLSVLAENVNTSGQVSLTTGVTGTLPIANGGTNSTDTPTAGGIGYGTGSAHAYTTAGTAGQALLSGGAGAPTWGNVQAFASGTVMLFAQTSAPTGWTKNTTTGNDSALRVTTGAVGTGGSVAFTTAFASQTPAGTVSTTITAATATNASYTPTGAVSVTSVAGTAGATTLSTPQIPSHTHGIQTYQGPGGTNGVSSSFTNGGAGVYQTQGQGGGGSHTHPFSFTSGSGSFTGDAATILQNSHTHTASSSFTGTAINLAVQYVDIIRATKD